jgi:uncharacterized Zn finger protein (UPF0148 family)
MTNVACFCGCLYFFDGGEGPCPQCGAVALVRTKAIRETSENREQGEPDQAMAAALSGSLRMAGLADPQVHVREVPDIARHPETGKARRFIPL